MEKTVKLEAFIGWPPTSKCRETLQVLDEVVQRHPGEVRLVVFKRGIHEYAEKPSPPVVKLIHKGSAVPVCFIDGFLLAMLRVPTPEEVETKVTERLGVIG
jgi:hypothetical protein